MNSISQQEPNNKLPFIYWYLFLFLLVALTTLTSCKAKALKNTHTIEKTIETNNDSKTKIEIVKDTSTKIETNKAVLDSVFIAVSDVKTSNKDCDSLVNVEVRKALKRLETKKKSGLNEYGVFYDELNNKLIFYVTIGETQNTTIAKNKTENKSTEKNKATFEKKSENKVTEIPVKYIPKWVQVFAFIGFLFVAYIIVKIYLKFTKPI